MLRTAANNNFKANYSAGGSVASFDLNPVIEWLGIVYEVRARILLIYLSCRRVCRYF